MKKSNTNKGPEQSKTIQITTPAGTGERKSDPPPTRMKDSVPAAMGPGFLPIEIAMLKAGQLTLAVDSDSPDPYVRIRRRSAQLLFDLTR